MVVYKKIKNNNFKHGLSYTKEYNAWRGLKNRCLNKNNPKYKDYGGRGITVCDRWLNSFDNFFEDMGICLKDLSLDRIDVNGNYCKENCRWATPVEQRNNQRRTLIINNKPIKLF